MSIAHGQRVAFLRLLESLRPLVGREVDFGARIEALLRQQKSMGSRDRRLHRELLYTWIRHLPWMEGCDEDALVGRVATLAAETTATRPFREAFALGSLPEGLALQALLPEWLRAECPRAFEEPLCSCLQRRAPLWLRLQTAEPEAVTAEFDQLGWPWRRSETLKEALRIDADINATKTRAWERGAFEVQDVGSQLILALAPVESGGVWLDACAGAGGKTLQLAGLLGEGGRIDAQDIRAEALEQLGLRARRAGLSVDGSRAQGYGERCARLWRRCAPGELYDGVLLDAPCSGSGTWRRAPHLKWSTQPSGIARCAALQSELLNRWAAQVRPGGLLVYATCSLCRSENEACIESFLAAQPGYALESSWSIDPVEHDSDAFFVAVLRRSGGA